MRKFTLTILTVALFGCASTPQGRLHQTGKAQKVAVDGLGNTYLDVCQEIVFPRCVEQDAEAAAEGGPLTREQRIACLGPCSSETAATIKTALSGVLAAQGVVFVLLKSGSADPARLEEARAELRTAFGHLAQVLRDTGAQDFIEQQLFGGK